MKRGVSRTTRPFGHSATGPLRDVRIGIIGTGTMGQAIINGLISRGLSPRQLAVSESDSIKRRHVASRFHLHVHSDNVHVLRDAQVIVFAVKPQQFPELIAQLAPHLKGRHLVISIAAGITLGWLQARLPGVAIVRVMPNLPATIGHGFSAIAPGRTSTKRHKAVAMALFQAVGSVFELPERYFDAITAVSGSGPAYIFFIVYALEEAARRLGLPNDVANEAVRKTLEGSTQLLLQSGADALDLIGKVASKGGTTEAALRRLKKNRIAALFFDALKAASRRSQQLSWS